MAVERSGALALLAGGKNAREYTVKLFDREVLPDIGSRRRGRDMHLFLVVADAGRHDYRQSRIHLADKTDQRNSIHLRHLEFNNGDLAGVLR